MTWDPNTRLRALLGETIPTGGADVDTFFTDADISNLLLGSDNILKRAAYEGWQMKAANYANLVNVTEGNALRQMSDLLNHALAMVKQFSGAGDNLTTGRIRVGRIKRSWF